MKCILDSHTHTIASGHAYSTITECAAAAAERGLSLLAITDHAAQASCTMARSYFGNFADIPKYINGVEVVCGVELNILNPNGEVDMEERRLKKMGTTIASLHQSYYSGKTVKENTAAVINAMKNPLIKIIGHLGDPSFPVDLSACVSAAAETGTVIELNNASLNPNSNSRKGGEQTVLDLAYLCAKMQVPVVFGSDAHFHTLIGHLEYSIEAAEKAGIPENLIMNTSLDLYKKHCTIVLK